MKYLFVALLFFMATSCSTSDYTATGQSLDFEVVDVSNDGRFSATLTNNTKLKIVVIDIGVFPLGGIGDAVHWIGSFINPGEKVHITGKSHALKVDYRRSSWSAIAFNVETAIFEFPNNENTKISFSKFGRQSIKPFCGIRGLKIYTKIPKNFIKTDRIKRYFRTDVVTPDMTRKQKDSLIVKAASQIFPPIYDMHASGTNVRFWTFMSTSIEECK